MKNELIILPEPELQFGHNQKLVAPHDGLSMFGPYDLGMPEHPTSFSYACIGTQNGLVGFGEFAKAIRGAIINDPLKLNPRLWPIFPGFEAAFHSTFPERPTLSLQLEEKTLVNGSMQNDPHKRAGTIVEQYLEKIRIVSKSDKNISVIICIVPDIVHKNCRPQSTVKNGIGLKVSANERKVRSTGQGNLFENYDTEMYQFSVDFRRQIKARAMEFNIPIQIILESTLRIEDTNLKEERGLTCLSDRAWNLAATLFYKAGGQPWKLANAREGVCYIGIVYRQTDAGSNSRSACCAAQMFLDSGDGIVFRGQDGRWYSPEDKAFHLSKNAAKDLLSGLIATYQELDGKPLKEIFLHCHSSIDTEEFAGFQEACPAGVSLVGVRVRQERAGVRLFREGKMPVLRGSYWEINKKTAYLWGSGYKPRIASYDGWETPAPLRIDIQHGEANIRQVATDILALTKLNYNSCRMGESEPVTIGFSDAVGEILVSNPSIAKPSPRFKMYI